MNHLAINQTVYTPNGYGVLVGWIKNKDKITGFLVLHTWAGINRFATGQLLKGPRKEDPTVLYLYSPRVVHDKPAHRTQSHDKPINNQSERNIK